jgi:hypothetical protein
MLQLGRKTELVVDAEVEALRVVVLAVVGTSAGVLRVVVVDDEAVLGRVVVVVDVVVQKGVVVGGVGLVKNTVVVCTGMVVEAPAGNGEKSGSGGGRRGRNRSGGSQTRAPLKHVTVLPLKL